MSALGPEDVVLGGIGGLSLAICVGVCTIPADGVIVAGEADVGKAGGCDSGRKAGETCFGWVVAALGVADERNIETVDAVAEVVDQVRVYDLLILDSSQGCVLNHTSPIGVGDRQGGVGGKAGSCQTARKVGGITAFAENSSQPIFG